MIIAENISKSYNSERVLKNVNLKIEDGDFVSIMGESGSGKSTMLNILGGFLSPDEGRVLWNNEDISRINSSKMSELRCTEVGFVFQSFKLISTLTAEDNIMLPATLGGNANKQTRDFVSSLVSELKLDGLLKKYPDELSGGQCQRVAIVRALAYKPSTIILDEPTGALDSGMEEVVMNLLCRVNKSLKTTVIQVTHSNKVAEYGKRIIKVKDGRIEE